jgi:hypothetical protein
MSFPTSSHSPMVFLEHSQFVPTPHVFLMFFQT